MDEVREELVAEARAFARRVDLLQRLDRLQTEGALAGQAQAPELEMAGSWSVSQLTAATWAADAARYATCLPLTLRLLAEGALLLHQARVLLTRTRHCPEDVCRAVEAEVLPDGALLCPADLRKRVDRLVLRLTSEQTDPVAAEQRHADTVASRRTFVRPDVEGMAVAAAVLTAEQTVAWQAAMDRLELRERAADRAAGVDRTADQRRADIFAALPMMVLAGTAQDLAATSAGGPASSGSVLAGAAPGASPAGAATPTPVPLTAPAGAGPAPLEACGLPLVPWTFTPEVLCAQVVLNVHVPVATVLDLSREPGSLDRYGPLSAEHVRLVRPHSYRRVLVDADTGVPLHVEDRPVRAADDAQQRRRQVVDMLTPAVITDADEPQHDPSASLARLVDLRDLHCSGPGCSSSRCDRDHRDPWPAGPTSVDNLQLLSRRCHRAKHHGWSVRRHRDGSSTWTSPLGRSYTRPGPHHPPPAVDLTAELPPVRERPDAGPQRWLLGEGPPVALPDPPSPRPSRDDEPPF